LTDLTLTDSAVVTGDVIVAVTVVDAWLKNLERLPRELGPAEKPEKLFGLAAEHTADNPFN
jgi:hypothetical protein